MMEAKDDLNQEEQQRNQDLELEQNSIESEELNDIKEMVHEEMKFTR